MTKQETITTELRAMLTNVADIEKRGIVLLEKIDYYNSLEDNEQETYRKKFYKAAEAFYEAISAVEAINDDNSLFMSFQEARKF